MDYKLKLPKSLVKVIREKRISQRDLTGVISDYITQYASKGQEIALTIDSAPADNGRYKPQRDWIDLFNKEGKAMISAPDVYRALDSVLPSLREDFSKSWLVTSTRVSYNHKDLSARIIHNFGSTVVKPKETSLIVPVYRNELVESVVAKAEGLRCLQALFSTKDNASKLIGRLERISEKEAKDIRIWTPDQDSRRNYSERSACFGYGGDRFHVCGDYWFDDYGGLSRGVSVKSALPTASKK